MDSFDTDIKKYTDKVRLTASERNELRERVFAYMEYHPLPKKESKRLVLEGIPSESFVTVHFHLNNLYMRIAGGVFVLFILVTPFLAEQSIPGDVLYVIKTGVNETVQAQLANSPYKKIEFETKLMNRRITEARVLASEGKLTEEVKNQLTETVKEHTTAVQEGLVALREKDAEGAAIAEISFNASLEVQSAMLDADEKIQDSTLVDSILTVMNDAREGVALSQVTNNASYDGLIAQVESETTRAFELFTTIKKTASKEKIQDIDRRLSDINRLIEEAKSLPVEQREVAVSDLSHTLGLIQKLIVFMTDTDVREVVPLANLIPVVLSDVERTSIVQGEIASLEVLRGTIATRISQHSEESGFVEKSSEALTQSDKLIERARLSIETKDIAGAESAVKDARTLLDDVEALIQRLFPGEQIESVTGVNATSTGIVEGVSTTSSSSTPTEGGEAVE